MKKIKLVMRILILIILCLSLFNFIKMFGWEKVCVAQRCNEWAYGDEWIKDNCHLNSDNVFDYCDINIEGTNYNVALKDINISLVKSCRESVCAVSIYAKQTGGKE